MKNIYEYDVWCFDLDGTILEGSEQFYQRCFHQTLKNCGIQIDVSEYPRGLNLESYLRIFWKDEISEEKQKEILHEYRKMQKEIPFTAQLFEDAEKFLKKHQHIAKVLVTNCSPDTIKIVNQTVPLSSYFEHIVDRKPSFLPKPNPHLYLFAASLYDINPEKCLVFEDSITGITAAKGANMYTIAVDRLGDLGNASEADVVISSFDEL